MNRISGVMKMQFTDKWGWMYLPWIILGSSFLVNMVVSYFVHDTIYSGGIMSIYIYIFVFGLIILSQTFPFALGFNVRRTDYFAGTVLSGAIICATVAVILLFFSVIEHDLTRGWGTDLHFFYLPYLNDGSIFAQLWVSFAITMHFYFLGFVISSIFRRFGKTGMFTFALVSFLGLSLFSLMSTSFQWWGDIFNFLIRFNAAEMASFLMLLVVLYVLASYRMLLRATVS